jgi:hypothetical protein
MMGRSRRGRTIACLTDQLIPRNHHRSALLCRRSARGDKECNQHGHRSHTKHRWIHGLSICLYNVKIDVDRTRHPSLRWKTCGPICNLSLDGVRHQRLDCVQEFVSYLVLLSRFAALGIHAKSPTHSLSRMNWDSVVAGVWPATR